MVCVFFRIGIIALWIILFFTFLTAPYLFPSSKKESETLNIFSWPEMLCPEITERFESETGIRVKRHYYTSNEELLVKLKATEGKGYDLIIPSDYAVKKLIEEDLLKPLDWSKLNFKQHLNPKLTHQYYDPENTYAVPFIWELLGFGIDKTAYESAPFHASWEEIFNPSDPEKKISMVNDPIEAIDIASHYLYGEEKELNAREVAMIGTTLKKQKSHIEAYAGVRGDYLLITKNCSLAVIPSSYVIRAAKNYEHIDYVIPEEYTFISIENFCIPKTSEKDEAVCLFLNYLYRPEVLTIESNTFYNFPATTNVGPFIKGPPPYQKTLKAFDQYEGSLYYTRDLLTDKESRTLWVEVKTAQ